jgi:hypothetical protein
VGGKGSYVADFYSEVPPTPQRSLGSTFLSKTTGERWGVRYRLCPRQQTNYKERSREAEGNVRGGPLKLRQQAFMSAYGRTAERTLCLHKRRGADAPPSTPPPLCSCPKHLCVL